MPRTKTIRKYHGRQRALIRDLQTDLHQLVNDTARGINPILVNGGQSGAATILLNRMNAAQVDTVTITIVTS
jgi:hypothetical protein